jgi:hypothetical protein
MSEAFDYLRAFGGFPRALRRFLHPPLTIEEARRLAARRLETREDTFLRIVDRAVYGHPRSPYLALLREAHCEAGDLRALVAQQGLEGALRTLRRAGGLPPMVLRGLFHFSPLRRPASLPRRTAGTQAGMRGIEKGPQGLRQGSRGRSAWQRPPSGSYCVPTPTPVR